MSAKLAVTILSVTTKRSKRIGFTEVCLNCIHKAETGEYTPVEVKKDVANTDDDNVELCKFVMRDFADEYTFDHSEIF